MKAPRSCLALFLLLFGHAAEAEERSWTNSDGRTIVATLVEVAGEKAVLQMAGKNFEVPVASLSPDDQKFIAEWKKGDMADLAADAKVKPNWDGPWPGTVSVAIDQPIEVIREDAASGEYVYASPHYEFICDVRLNTSLVKRFSLLFEATNQVCRELPLGWVKPFRQERHKIHLFETREAYIAKGGPPDSAGVYISRGGEGDILIPLTSLGVKKVGSSYSVDYKEENTTLSHEITHQLTDAEYFSPGARGWFSEGVAEYVAHSGYRSGKFSVNDLGKLKDWVTDYGSDGRGGRALGTNIDAPNLEDFFSQSYDSFLANGSLNYGLAALVVYYYFHMDGSRDAANVKAFLKAMKEGKTPPEVYEPLLAGRSWDEMEAAITQGWRSRGVRINFR
jgi:hypothetical protein